MTDTTPASDRPADLLRAAAEKLRAARFSGAMTATPVVAALVSTRMPFASWLDVAADHARQGFMCCDNGPDHCAEVVTPALAVARQLLGTTGEDTTTEEQEPIQLRWGLDDVMYGDDDTTTILLSGPGGEPYWVELDPERTAALQDALAGPAAPPAPVDRAATRDRIRRAICEASGFTWLPDELMEPDEYGEHADAVLAALAGEAAAGVRPTKTQWAVEVYDPRHSTWVALTRFHAPEVAADAITGYEKNTSTWPDGSLVQHQVVREETTYTVEPSATPATPATPAAPAVPEERP